jgi:dTMP kinase
MSADSIDGVDALVDPDAQASYRALLANRNYRRFFLASLGASLGDWAGLFALQTLVVSISVGTRLALFALGGIMMARLVPSLLVGPVAGVLADRYDRRRLMVFCSVVRGILFIGVAFSRDLAALLALTFIVECLSLVFVAAKDAALPSVVERSQLQEANQLNLLVTYGSLPFGGAIAAVLTGLTGLLAAIGIGIDGIRLALLGNALAFIVAAGLLSGLKLPPRLKAADREDSPGFLAELRAGLEFINDRPLIRSLILGVVGIFFGAGVVVSLGPEFVRTELDRPATDWSLLVTAVGGGLGLGILVVGPLTRRAPKEKVFPWGLAVTGGLAAVLATLPNFTLTLMVGFALGVSAGIAFVLGYTLLQERTPDEVRARTFTTFYTGTRIALFAALGVAPFLAGAIGRGRLILGGLDLNMSGIRLAILAGGLFGLFSALSAGRGMYRAMRTDAAKHVRLAPKKPPKPPAEGVFISFEGVEGAGKSTQVAALVRTLEAEGHDVVVTREPGGPPVAERIRQVLLDPNVEGMHPRTEALLYAAARAEHVQRVIRPALEAGKVVVTDRFLDSSLAYQGFARGLGAQDVMEINQWATLGVLPAVVVLLHLDPEEGLRRATERTRRRATQEASEASGVPTIGVATPDRLEAEDLAFHRRVAEGYLELARMDRSRYVVVNALADAATVAKQVRSGLHAWLPLPSVDTAPPQTTEMGPEARPGAAG